MLYSRMIFMLHYSHRNKKKYAAHIATLFYVKIGLQTRQSFFSPYIAQASLYVSGTWSDLVVTSWE